VSHNNLGGITITGFIIMGESILYYSIIFHSGKYTSRWSQSLGEVCSPVRYTSGEKNGYSQGQIVNTKVPIWSWSTFWPQIIKHSKTANRKIFTYISLGQSQTTFILGLTWCEVLGFYLISIMRHLASGHFQEAFRTLTSSHTG